LLAGRADGRAHACTECATRLERHEGPPHARAYEFPARTVAAALVAVGNGVSYHRAARTARASTKWARRRSAAKSPQGARRASGANGTMAGDWVGLFAPMVCGPAFDAEEWPEVVALDDLPFVGSRPRQAGRRAKQETSWVVFGAYANPTAQGGQIFRLHAAPKLNSAEAAAWLRSIPGRPKVVVSDGSGVWPKAVRDAWPEVVDPATGEVLAATPRLTRCEHHLRATLRSVMRTTGILQPREEDPFVAAPPPNAWAKPDNFRQVGRVRAERPEPPNPRWTPELGRKRTGAGTPAGPVAGGLHVRPGPDREPGRRVPRTIGGLEGALATVRRMLRDRAHLLNNTVRTNRLLDLMTLQLRGVADERAYAARILEALAPAGGHAPRHWLGDTGAARVQTCVPGRAGAPVLPARDPDRRRLAVSGAFLAAARAPLKVRARPAHLRVPLVPPLVSAEAAEQPTHPALLTWRPDTAMVDRPRPRVNAAAERLGGLPRSARIGDEGHPQLVGAVGMHRVWGRDGLRTSVRDGPPGASSSARHHPGPGAAVASRSHRRPGRRVRGRAGRDRPRSGRRPARAALPRPLTQLLSLPPAEGW
jgi:hypothetical protein